MTTTTPYPLAARLQSEPQRDRPCLILVNDPDIGVVPVRWQVGKPWRCTCCGVENRATCGHAYGAGLLLADLLLGLEVANVIDQPEENQ